MKLVGLDIIGTSKTLYKKAEDNGASIDYEDPKQVKNLMAKHLSKIFIATHKEKIKKEIDNIKATCK